MKVETKLRQGVKGGGNLYRRGGVITYHYQGTQNIVAEMSVDCLQSREICASQKVEHKPVVALTEDLSRDTPPLLRH